MSCVAELNAINQKNTSVYLKKDSKGMVRPISARQQPIYNCMPIIQDRFVFTVSIIGLQNGLITHGKYSQLV